MRVSNRNIREIKMRLRYSRRLQKQTSAPTFGVVLKVAVEVLKEGEVAVEEEEEEELMRPITKDDLEYMICRCRRLAKKMRR